ncbi:hypothetical protein [Polyangium fumosum]|uniref:Glycosyltransferase RgtA/B/C/D-like domain-containing protein n=1 Tax=Polyangium fumosum TaxID=889272 RepID=A0A4V5PN50_9BACT|nr:hypothetical protein [Polyangium fumosum]TKD03253.1 hypothetical protein E8A74_26305 [Polyangium fumosum]
MDRPLERPDDRSRRWLFAAVIYTLVTVVCLATTGRERLTTHTPYNHFALLADAWLHGRLDLGGPPPAYTGNNDFVVWEGKHYVSFPPFPAVLLLPAVKLAGSVDRVRDGQIFALFTGLAPALLYLGLDALARAGRTGRSERENVLLSLLFAFGTVYWFSAVQGTVWFAAHVVGAALAALYLFASVGAAHPILAGLAIGLGFATRTPLGFAFPLFVYEAVRASANAGASGRVRLADVDARALATNLALFAVPAAAVLGVLLWYNAARFGDPFEFGHRLLAITWRARIERWGLFSYHYLGRNLGVILTSLPYTGTSSAPFQINAHGLALWVTTPIYAWVLWPRRTPPSFWAVALTAACVALPSLLYQNSGWIQFGYRFSNDFAVFLFALLALGKRRLGGFFWAFALISVLVNAFGAVTFQRAAYGRFYFVDPTQKILHHPD